MDLPKVLTIEQDGMKLMIFAPHYATRSDGTDKFVVSQAYSLQGGKVARGDALVVDGMTLVATNDLEPEIAGILSFRGIVLGVEEATPSN